MDASGYSGIGDGIVMLFKVLVGLAVVGPLVACGVGMWIGGW